MRYTLLFLFASLFVNAQINLSTPFEKGNKNQSTTYEECISFYQLLDANSDKIEMRTMGLTDSGKPLHIIVFSENKNFNFNQNKAVLLINNGIHPGEPDGIDATMMLMRDIANAKIKVPKNTMVVAIPVYNIDGMLNRNSFSRANQNGPEAYGFRGNGRNYDLNRDFIKSDTRNSRSFQELFHSVNPDVFLDNHVSNGADYQYTFTCIATQHERLGEKLGNFFKNEMYPEMVNDMQKKNIDVIPYVNIHGAKPDLGYEQFTDTPRYATGYTTLFNTLGFVPETHMLKPYKDRVKTTYEFMVTAINYTDANWEKIKQVRKANLEDFKAGKQYPLHWEIDSTKVSYMDFKGYEGGYKPSDLGHNNAALLQTGAHGRVVKQMRQAARVDLAGLAAARTTVQRSGVGVVGRLAAMPHQQHQRRQVLLQTHGMQHTGRQRHLRARLQPGHLRPADKTIARGQAL